LIEGKLETAMPELVIAVLHQPQLAEGRVPRPLPLLRVNRLNRISEPPPPPEAEPSPTLG
jgi:hypothetical protein